MVKYGVDVWKHQNKQMESFLSRYASDYLCDGFVTMFEFDKVFCYETTCHLTSGETMQILSLCLFGLYAWLCFLSDMLLLSNYYVHYLCFTESSLSSPLVTLIMVLRSWMGHIILESLLWIFQLSLLFGLGYCCLIILVWSLLWPVDFVIVHPEAHRVSTSWGTLFWSFRTHYACIEMEWYYLH